jgi:hypothetical protein
MVRLLMFLISLSIRAIRACAVPTTIWSSRTWRFGNRLRHSRRSGRGRHSMTPSALSGWECALPGRGGRATWSSCRRTRSEVAPRAISPLLGADLPAAAPFWTASCRHPGPPPHQTDGARWLGCTAHPRPRPSAHLALLAKAEILEPQLEGKAHDVAGVSISLVGYLEPPSAFGLLADKSREPRG